MPDIIHQLTSYLIIGLCAGGLLISYLYIITNIIDIKAKIKKLEENNKKRNK